MKIDIGKLSQEEAAELCKEIITVALPEEMLFAVLEEALTTEQKEELGEAWFNLDRK